MFRKCDLAPQLSPEGARTLNGYYGGVESLIHLTTCLRRHHWPLTSRDFNTISDDRLRAIPPYDGPAVASLAMI